MRPELLMPAGNLEKLKVAVLYGADAVYLGGQQFGLRSAADNFNREELAYGVSFAHQRGAKVYVVLNSFLFDQELQNIDDFVLFLEKQNVDAVIVSDMGVLHTVKKLSSLKIHLSTQASCLNSYSAKLWKNQGVTRVILGREVSIEEAKKIKQETGLEVEMFIHGAMCMSYSGNCLVSNYTFGRDSNRGGCAHTCRFLYSLNDNEASKQRFFMSSKDLCGIELLDKFEECGIDSLKIEGRMKSHLYVGTLAKAYSQKMVEEVNRVTHREYCQGSLLSPADESSIYFERQTEEKEYVLAGHVLEVREGEYMVMEVRHAFFPGDQLELLPFKKEVQTFEATSITDMVGNEYQKTRPGSLVKLPYVEGAEKWNIVRVRA